MISGAREMNGPDSAGNGTACNLASAFLILAVLAYGAAAYQRNQIWKTGLSMAEDNIRNAPMNPRARLNLGMAYKDLDMLNKAKEEFRAAVFLAPRYADVHNNLSNVFL
ncbi:MAG: hypothetical protein HZB83_08385, partial [Deltaproteobacteria bacterium]|nr:hypothetical protein [Deltaproteobacteria bacterium]